MTKPVLKNLAGFKRELVPGTKLKLFNLGLKDPSDEPRVVLKLRSRDIVFLKPPFWVPSFCSIGLAKYWQFEGSTATLKDHQNLIFLSYEFLTEEEFTALMAEKYDEYKTLLKSLDEIDLTKGIQ